VRDLTTAPTLWTSYREGAVAGRSQLNPDDGDVAAAVDTAAALVMKED